MKQPLRVRQVALYHIYGRVPKSQAPSSLTILGGGL